MKKSAPHKFELYHKPSGQVRPLTEQHAAEYLRGFGYNRQGVKKFLDKAKAPGGVGFYDHPYRLRSRSGQDTAILGAHGKPGGHAGR